MLMTATAYPQLRASLGPAFHELNDEQIDALVANLYGPGVAAEDVEGFFGDIGRGLARAGRSVGRIAQQAAPHVLTTLGGVAQGAATGAGFGGPIGAIVGAVAGGAGSALSQTNNPTLRGIGGALGTATQLASQFSPTGRLGGLANTALGALGQAAAGRGGAALAQAGQGLAGALAGGGGAQGVLGGLLGAAGGAARGGSANALLGMLTRPETLRALSAAAMGPAGRSQVLVGQQPVGVQSILSALGSLAGRAAREAEVEGGAEAHAWLRGASGEALYDPTDAEQRTDALLELYATTPAPWLHEPEPEEPVRRRRRRRRAEPLYTQEDAFADAWLLAGEAAWSEAWNDEGENDELDA